MQHLIQMQSMSIMSGNSADSFSSGIRDMAFQSMLEAAMSQGPKAPTNRSFTAVDLFQTYPPETTAGVESVKPKKVEVKDSEIDAMIAKASEAYGVDADLIRSVVKAESNFDADVVSHAGAQGLMQLMPATARGLGVSDPFDPEQNIMGGTKYLKQMLDKYDGDSKLALAAYNAGPGNVDKYGGVPPFQETQHYVRKVLDFV
ncbi:lytic transglycosylase domain-containing protein [Halobacillus litoralis]|nr:lytic transglycosylase domain-containing protein [Halobacillus litoralis]MCA0972595.1 lytic transglycosylase domain-containing protein [Halobacillus litoralis]